MAVFIEGMEMPKDGVYWCEIGVAGEIATITIHGEDRKSFPLVPIPEHHGDLIDRMELLQTVKDKWKASSVNAFNLMLYVCNNFLDFIIKAQTVIPASEEGEHG